MGKVAGPEAVWAADPPARWRTETVGLLLADQAAQTPDAAVLHWLRSDGRLETWTYSELFDRSARVATLIGRLVPPGGRVAVCAPNSLEWVAALCGSALAGTLFVPMNPAMGEPELAHILELTAPELLLGVDSYRSIDVGGRLDRAGERLDRPPRTELLGEFAARSSAESPAESPATDSSLPFLVQYTSGTSGRPKGAVLTHEAAVNAAANFVAGWGHGPDDILVGPLPLHHVAGSIGGVVSALVVGASAAFLPEYDPVAVVTLLEATDATILGAVPTMLYDLQRQPGFDAERLSSLRFILGGGAAVPESTVRDIEATFGVEFLVAYGQSESVAIAQTYPGDPADVKARTIGRPNPGREVKIADIDSGDPVEIETVGEICQRSSQQMTEYLAMPDETAETIDADGWLHTGDLGSMDSDGNITFRGRARDVIIRGGENIYPDQVESAYADMSAIHGIAVVGLADDRWGEVPIGVVVLAPGEGLDPAALEAHGRARLASFQVPRRWVAVDEFPMTASGKVRKVELEPQVRGLL